MRALGIVSRLLLLASSFGVALAPEVAHAEPAERAYVGVYLHDVTHFDQRNGTFDIDADVWLKWHGELDPSRLRVQNASVELDTVDLGESSDGDWHSHRYHLRGTLRGEFPLHRFPFDVQTLGIQFELPGTGTELVPDLAGSGIAFPAENQYFWELTRAGKWDEARAIYRWFTPLLHLDCHTRFVQYIKLAVQQTGLGTEWVRAPRLVLTGAGRREVLKVIHDGIANRPKLPRRA